MGMTTRNHDAPDSVREEQALWGAQDERTRQALKQAAEQKAKAKRSRPLKQFVVLSVIQVTNVFLHNPELNPWVNSWLPFDIAYHPTWSFVYYASGPGFVVIFFLMIRAWRRFSFENEAYKKKNGKKSRLRT